MARKDAASSYGYSNPFNEIGSARDDPAADVNGATEMYMGGWPEINRMHLANTGPMTETPNSMSGLDSLGGPAPGEPDARKR